MNFLLWDLWETDQRELIWILSHVNPSGVNTTFHFSGDSGVIIQTLSRLFDPHPGDVLSLLPPTSSGSFSRRMIVNLR